MAHVFRRLPLRGPVCGSGSQLQSTGIYWRELVLGGVVLGQHGLPSQSAGQYSRHRGTIAWSLGSKTSFKGMSERSTS